MRLIVGTYLSAARLHETLQSTGVRLDLLILDEAHHLTGSTALPSRRITEKTFLPAMRRLYMTATPRSDASTARAGAHLSMDDTNLFGPVLSAEKYVPGARPPEGPHRPHLRWPTAGRLAQPPTCGPSRGPSVRPTHERPEPPRNPMGDMIPFADLDDACRLR
jgi:hypothetical protein